MSEYGRPIDPTDFYGVQDAIAGAIDLLTLDDDPDPKVLRRLRMAFTAAGDSDAAVWAERERCATLCETLDHGAFGSTAFLEGVRIGSIGCAAAAIRKGGTP